MILEAEDFREVEDQVIRGEFSIRLWKIVQVKK